MSIVSSCGKTDIGRKRSHNEDSFAVEPDDGLFIVADGMGGHAGGEIASSMAVETIREFVKKGLSDSEITWPFGFDHSLPKEINIISSGMRLANRRIFNESKGMGTTMVVLLLKDDKAYICNVGDSRLYRIRDNKIHRLTEDHSLVAEEMRRGVITEKDAKHHPMRHIITRSLGMNADVKCDYKVEDIVVGDMFLLCSDGLSGMLDDSEILEIATGSYDIKGWCDKLIQRANEKGGDDNITVILVKCN